MLTTYPAIFYKEKDGSFSVVFPDLNHLSTDGENFNDAMTMAIDCLAGYVYSEKRDGNELPPPTPIDELDPHCEDDSDDDFVSIFTSAVAVDVEQYAKQHFDIAVKKTLSIPKWLNDKAKAHKINFSKILQNALMQELNTNNQYGKEFT